jgi:hypothetical protein
MLRPALTDPITPRLCDDYGPFSTSMSATADRPSLAPRARRIRNRCVQSLARLRSLPIPGDQEVAQFGDELRLSDIMKRWEELNTPPSASPAIKPPPSTLAPPRWRSPALQRVVLTVLVGVLGFVLGDQLLPPAQAAVANGPAWYAITDSVVGALNGKLIALNQSEVVLPVSLTPAEVASLAFRRRAHVDSVEARADSVLRVRGVLDDTTRFELEGRVRVQRRGTAELRITRLWLNGLRVSPGVLPRAIAGRRTARPDSMSLRFTVPANVTRIVIRCHPERSEGSALSC